MYDRGTDSLWVQATGRAILGPYKGSQLRHLPVTHTTWREWIELFPNTVVLAKPTGLIDRYRIDGYTSFYARNRTQFGLGVFVGGAQKLFPLAALTRQPLVQDEIAGRSVLVAYHVASRTAIAWDANLDGRTRAFEPIEQTALDMTMRDRSTDSVWSGLRGECLAGSDRGRRLRQLQTTQFVLSNWPRHFPNGAIFQSGSNPAPPQ